MLQFFANARLNESQSDHVASTSRCLSNFLAWLKHKF